MSSLLSFFRKAIGSVFGTDAKSADFQRDGGVIAFRLLQHESVRNELNLNIEQVGHVLRLTRQARQVRKKQFQALRNQDRQAMASEAAKLARAVAQEVLANLRKEAVFTEEQVERLRQITRQNQGANAFSTSLIQEALAITPGQQEILKTVIQEGEGKMRELVKNAGDQSDAERKEALTALRLENLSKVLSLLSDEQRNRWEQLKGKPFDVSLDGNNFSGFDSTRS